MAGQVHDVVAGPADAGGQGRVGGVVLGEHVQGEVPRAGQPAYRGEFLLDVTEVPGGVGDDQDPDRGVLLGRIAFRPWPGAGRHDAAQRVAQGQGRRSIRDQFPRQVEQEFVRLDHQGGRGWSARNASPSAPMKVRYSNLPSRAVVRDRSERLGDGSASRAHRSN